MFKMPRRLRHTPKILVALTWILPGYFYFSLERVGQPLAETVVDKKVMAMTQFE